MKRALSGLVALSLALGLTGPAQADFDFTTFDVPGAIETIARGINDAGQIVGNTALLLAAKPTASCGTWMVPTL
jgi:hypothetical protein